MKNFNKQIQITVELDAIANALLETINPEFKHAENVVEAIIGRLDASNDQVGMTALYNALNGYDNTINFKPGDTVICSKSAYAYWTQESIVENNTVMRAIGECEVIEVNPYANDKLRIRYAKPQKNGLFSDEDLWVNHSTCKLISVEQIAELMG